MISLATLAAQPFQPLRGSRDQTLTGPGRDKASAGVGLPSLSDMQDQLKAQRKEMAARKVQAVRERVDALKLMVKLDPKAALKMTAEMAKALKAAVKDYVEAGGKNPTVGEMKMMMKQATEARDAAAAAAGTVPVEPKTDASGAVEAEATEAAPGDAGANAAPIDADMERARAAYATAAGIAEGKDAYADRQEVVLGLAFADTGFFEQVRLALGELKDAREKIRGDWAHPRKPDEDDWKVADKEMAELEKAIDFAPTGMPEAMAELSVRA